MTNKKLTKSILVTQEVWETLVIKRTKEQKRSVNEVLEEVLNLKWAGQLY